MPKNVFNYVFLVISGIKDNTRSYSTDRLILITSCKQKHSLKWESYKKNVYLVEVNLASRFVRAWLALCLKSDGCVTPSVGGCSHLSLLFAAAFSPTGRLLSMAYTRSIDPQPLSSTPQGADGDWKRLSPLWETIFQSLAPVVAPLVQPECFILTSLRFQRIATAHSAKQHIDKLIRELI